MKKRKILYLAIAACLVFMYAAVSAGASGETPTKIVILDPAGEQQVAQVSLDAFKAKYKNLVSDIEVIAASAPETTTKIQAEQAAQNLITTFVFTGYDGMSGGLESGIYEQLLPQFASKLPGLQESLTEAAKLQINMVQGYGIPHTCSPGGPITTYNPARITNPPKTAEELLAFAKANPGKFMYPRPSNSGAGYAWLQGIPFLLREKDPTHPKNWTKVWPYLKEIGKYVEYYPTGSALCYKEFNEGTRWIITTAVGYETNQRVLGAMPATMKQNFFTNLQWVSDANFICIPKGLDEARKNLSVMLLAYLMTPEQQAYTYDDGFMYPGPAIKNVPLSMAPKASQAG